ncbi:hypothetical protein [Dyadobacter tibetensis]|uniref:hypothetical protein n=1 Tax=Dyadobacter tibetensis TaxID=1211851 RepID=UPI0004BB2564|nr:hypothetical protein [Dyadobacter tibetensis]
MTEVLEFSCHYDRFVEEIEKRMLAGELVLLPIDVVSKVIVEGISPSSNILIEH